jgi:hypothetical protein
MRHPSSAEHNSVPWPWSRNYRREKEVKESIRWREERICEGKRKRKKEKRGNSKLHGL